MVSLSLIMSPIHTMKLTEHRNTLLPSQRKRLRARSTFLPTLCYHPPHIQVVFLADSSFLTKKRVVTHVRDQSQVVNFLKLWSTFIVEKVVITLWLLFFFFNLFNFFAWDAWVYNSLTRTKVSEKFAVQIKILMSLFDRSAFISFLEFLFNLLYFNFFDYWI